MMVAALLAMDPHSLTIGDALQLFEQQRTALEKFSAGVREGVSGAAQLASLRRYEELLRAARTHELLSPPRLSLYTLRLQRAPPARFEPGKSGKEEVRELNNKQHCLLRVVDLQFSISRFVVLDSALAR